jgi:hypothetical protein
MTTPAASGFSPQSFFLSPPGIRSSFPVNGRIGRLLVAVLVEHWELLDARLLYLSVAFKRHRAEYYAALDRVRMAGDWEAWTEFFLRGVRESALAAMQAFRIFLGEPVMSMSQVPRIPLKQSSATAPPIISMRAGVLRGWSTAFRKETISFPAKFFMKAGYRTYRKWP